MLNGYSGKFSQKQCEIQLSRINLGKNKVLKNTFFRLPESLKPQILATMRPTPNILGLLQTSRFELLGGWCVCK